jgi:hypothetical protein
VDEQKQVRKEDGVGAVANPTKRVRYLLASKLSHFCP